MKILQDYNLAKHNNLRLNSIAKEFIIPENYNDLIAILKLLKERQQTYHLLSGGSNVLLRPTLKTPVIFLAELDKTLSYDKVTNTVVAGCSIKIQTLINFLADNNLGGIEYLYSLPALVGGCVCMNAGRGKKFGISISDYILSVEYIEDGKLKVIDKPACGFGYRSSVFQYSNRIITKAVFRFPYQEKEVTKKKIKERLEYVKAHQEPQKPSLGSIFSDYDPRVLKKVKGIKIGKAAFSQKTLNWIMNLGSAKYSHIIALIKLVQFISFCTTKKTKLEIRIFK